MTTVFHTWVYGRFIETQSNLRRKKLHRMNQSSNFIVIYFSHLFLYIKFGLRVLNNLLYNLIIYYIYNSSQGNLKLVSAIFYENFIFHEMIALQKLWKMFFILSEKLYSFSRYSNFCIFIFPSFFPVSHCFRGWFKKNLKVCDIISCLNKNLITHYVWYLEKEIRCDIETLSIDRELNKEHFYGKIMQKMCTKSYPQTPF